MKKALTVGLHIRYKARLHGRLTDVDFSTASDAEKALSVLDDQKMDLLVIDEALDGAEAFLQKVQPLSIPTIFCAGSENNREGFLKSLVKDLGVDAVLSKPIDPDELVLKASELLEAPRIEEVQNNSAGAQMRAKLATLWARFEPENRDRVKWLKQQIDDIFEEKQKTDEDRREMERMAHKLVGALGTFGFPKASILAREIEQHVGETQKRAALDPDQLFEWIRGIEKELNNPPSTPPLKRDTNAGPSALLISEDLTIESQLNTLKVKGASLATTRVSGWSKARESWFLNAPDIVVADLCGELGEERRTLLRSLAGRLTTIPVLSIIPQEIWSNPDALAQFAGMPVLFHPFEPSALASSVQELLQQDNIVKPKLLAVDDDPQILATLEAILAPLKLDITTLSDPLEFWDVLESVSPDLLVLDVDMPFLNGLELCRGVRSNPKWSELPVLFLSASSDAGLMNRVFAVGADDFVKKPFNGPELATRIVNRIVRSKPKPKGEAAALTTTGLEGLKTLLQEESAHGRDVALALVSTKNESALKQSLGHAQATLVHRKFGERLVETLRDLGTVTKWHSSEFLIAFPGQTLEGAQQQLQVLLASSEHTKVVLEDGKSVQLEPVAGLTRLQGADDRLGDALRRCQRAVNSALENQQLLATQLASKTGKDTQVKRCSLLILEPAEQTGKAVESLMKDRGFDCLWDPNTDCAIAALTSEPPTLETQVIFVSSGGLELLAKLGPITKLVNVVVAVSNEDELAKAFDSGAFDCLEKPCKVTTLVKRLERAFDF